MTGSRYDAGFSAMHTATVPIATGRWRLLTFWVAATVLLGAAIAILAWIIARQARALEVERGRDATERVLLARRDIVLARVSALRTWLAEASDAPALRPLPEWLPGDEVLAVRAAPGGMRALAGHWLFTPDSNGVGDDDQRFLQVERAEFSSPADRDDVVAAYRRLLSDGSADIRAGAAVRLARVLARQGDHAAALAALQPLATMSDGRIDGVPAALVARVAMLPLLDRLGQHAAAASLADEIARGLEVGRWPPPAAAWRLYCDVLARRGRTVAVPRARLALAQSAEIVLGRNAWGDVATVIPTASGAVLALTRSGAQGRVLLLLDSGALLPDMSDDTSLLDAEGRAVAGPSRQGNQAGAAGAVTVPVGAASLLLHAPVRRIGPPWHLRGDIMAVFAAVVVISCLGAGSWGLWRGLARELRLNALQSQFIAAVSHELRTPVTSLRYMTDMLMADRVPPERLRDYHGVLGRESRRLQSTVEGLLQFGRLESGVAHLGRERIAASTLVRTAVDDFEAGRDGASPRLQVTGEDTRAHVLGDVPALLVALRNLIDNAVKYSPGADVVEVSTTMDASSVRIHVRDFGAGLAPGEHAVIFRRFTRGAAAERTGAPGTGLGLALSQHIAAAHGGGVEIEHSGSDGTVFVLRLPVAP